MNQIFFRVNENESAIRPPACATLVIAIRQEPSDLIPVNHYARIRNSGEGRNLKDLAAIYNILEPIVVYCDGSASFVLLFDVS
jgi:hypothetical protein